MSSFKDFTKSLFGPERPSPSYPTLPDVNKHGETRVKGLYIKGDAVGNPLIKVGLNDGYEWTEHIKDEVKQYSGKNDYDVIIVGSGATGFGAANRAKELGLSYLVLESERFANIIQNFTKGKILFNEPHSLEQKGSIWFEECTKDELLQKWEEHRQKIDLNMHEFEKVEDVQGKAGSFKVTTAKGEYTSSLVLLGIGKSGNPRKAGVPGEAEYPEKIFHFLSDAEEHQGKNILIYGGGDVAAEATLALCDHNNVTLATIDDKFIYPKKRNADAMLAKQAEGKLKIHFNTALKSIGKDTAELVDRDSDETTTIDNDVVFEMIGALVPLPFFNKLGIHLANSWHGSWIAAIVLGLLSFLSISYWAFSVGNGIDSINTSLSGLGFIAGMVLLAVMGWKGNRYSWLSFAMLLSYVMYAAKGSTPHFPFHWIGKDPINEFLGTGFFGYFVPDLITSFKGAPSFWYSALYTVLVVGFGLKARKRWGTDMNDSYQKKRFVSIILFQLVFFIVVNMILSVVIGPYYWRGWGLYQPFPLFYNTFFWWYPNDPVTIKYFFQGFGLLLTFVFIPLFVRWHGLRFCTWICGCGGLAETLGDQWRHLAPKGKKAEKWEFMGPLIVVWSFISLAVIYFGFGTDGNNIAWQSYDYIVDFWLVAIIPIGLYPFFGGKVWCRYWCPLAHYMKFLSRWFGKLEIQSNSKCISCTQCSTYCQVGVDVMSFAKNGESFDNTNSSCIHCGICVSVCPMDVLSFNQKDGKPEINKDSMEV